MTNQTILGQTLKLIRKTHRDNLKGMADKTGTTSAYVCSLNNGYGHPTKEFILKVIEAYQMTEEAAFYLVKIYKLAIKKPLEGNRKLNEGK